MLIWGLKFSVAKTFWGLTFLYPQKVIFRQKLLDEQLIICFFKVGLISWEFEEIA